METVHYGEESRISVEKTVIKSEETGVLETKPTEGILLGDGHVAESGREENDNRPTESDENSVTASMHTGRTPVVAKLDAPLYESVVNTSHEPTRDVKYIDSPIKIAKSYDVKVAESENGAMAK